MKKIMIKTLAAISLAFILTMPARADFMFSIEGTGTNIDSGFTFPTLATGVFDENTIVDLGGGLFAIPFGDGSGNHMTHSFNDVLFLDENLDIDFDGGFFPAVILDPWSFDFIVADYFWDSGPGYLANYSAFGLDWFLTLDGGGGFFQYEGSWDINTLTFTEVAEPATLSLLGGALLLLAFARRKVRL